MATLPANRFFWRVEGAADDAWTEASTATPDPAGQRIEYKVFGPSPSARRNLGVVPGLGVVTITAGDNGEIVFASASDGDSFRAVVATPADYAGTYDATDADLADGPVKGLAPVTAGSLGTGNELTAETGAWVSAAPQPAIIVQEWVRNVVAGNPESGLLLGTGPTYTQTVADAGLGLAYRERAADANGVSFHIGTLRATPTPALLLANRTGIYRDFSDLDVLAQNADGSGAVTAVDDPVEFIRDPTGAGLHFAAPDPSMAMTLKQVSSRNVLRGPGALMSLVDFNSENELTLLVARAVSGTISGSAVLFQSSHTTGFCGFIERSSGDRWEAQMRVTVGTTGAITLATAEPTTPEIYVMRYSRSEANFSAWRRNTLIESVDMTGASTVASGNRRLVLGGSLSGDPLALSNSGPVDYYGFFAVNAALSADERADLVTHFADIMGLS